MTSMKTFSILVYHSAQPGSVGGWTARLTLPDGHHYSPAIQGPRGALSALVWIGGRLVEHLRQESDFLFDEYD